MMIMRYRVRCTTSTSSGIAIRKVCDTDAPDIADFAFKNTVENVGEKIIVMFLTDGDITKVETGKYTAK